MIISRKILLYSIISLFLIALPLVITGCYPSPRLTPAAHIDHFEGYASLKGVHYQQFKSKVAFLIFPDRGKIDVLGPVGGSRAQIFIYPQKSFLVIPRHKIYWSSSPEEITRKFLGFALTIEEVNALLTGQWPEKEMYSSLNNWLLTRDEQGKIIEGVKEAFFFEVEEFFEHSSFPRKIVYFGPDGKGEIKLLTLQFNQPVKPAVFDQTFLQEYQPKTWEEIAKLLENES